MPLVVVGPGVRAGQRLDYAEQIDIVPTLCYMMGVKPPSNADGRVLAEALTQPPEKVPPRRQTMKELDFMLRDGNAGLERLRRDAEKSPTLKIQLAAAEHDFYGLDRILHWYQFGTVDKLLAHNRSVLEKISTHSRVTP
jgi:hypothetical protein